MAHNEVDFSPFHQEIQGALHSLNGYMNPYSKILLMAGFVLLLLQIMW